MKRNDEQGAVVVESTWCILLALFVCLFFISYGFVLYQHAVVTIVANDIAEEVGQTYKLQNAKDTSDVQYSDVYNVGKYRYLVFKNDFDKANDRKALVLACERLGVSSLAEARSPLYVNVDKISDDIGRFHLKVTVRRRYEFLFGDLLSLIGQRDAEMVEASVNVVGTDMLHHANMLHTTSYFMTLLNENEGIKLIDNAFKIIGTLFNIGC